MGSIGRKMASRKKIETLRRAALDARGVSRVLRVLRREAPGWNAPIVGFIAVQHRDPFRTLISCILSLRTKDATTATASVRLFARAHTPDAMLALTPKTVELLIYPVGFYRTKARDIRGICRDLIEKFEGRVPDEIDALLTLKGVARKTANLVVPEAYAKPVMCIAFRIDGDWCALRRPTNPSWPCAPFCRRGIGLSTTESWWRSGRRFAIRC